MDIAAFKNLYALAAPFIECYDERQQLTRIQIKYRDSSECSNEEKLIIDVWLTNNTRWLVENEVKYNRCIALLALPKQDIEALYAMYEVICGGTDDTRI
jgi:hypothetical protein